LGQIDTAIRLIDDLLRSNGVEVDVPAPAGVELSNLIESQSATVKPARVPLAQRRDVLRSYLAVNGPATRAEILTNTDIPAGTLSALLARDEFERTPHGDWRLKGSP
jgi:hypothetical protein